MTIREAITLLDNLLGMVEDNQANDYDAALKIAIGACSFAENHGWHDLKKNPDDLPPTYVDVLITDGGWYGVCSLQEPYYDCDDVAWRSDDSGEIVEEVVAWKYIDVWEGETDE